MATRSLWLVALVALLTQPIIGCSDDTPPPGGTQEIQPPDPDDVADGGEDAEPDEGPDAVPDTDLGPDADAPDAVVVAPPGPGQIVVTELMIEPAAAAAPGAQWVEVTNVGGAPASLAGCVLTSEGDGGWVIPADAGVVLAPGQFVVIAGSADANGGIAPDAVFEGVTLEAGTDSVGLSCGGTLIDEVAWSLGDAFPRVAGASRQLDPAASTADGNDDASNWCAGLDAFGDGDLGSPGALNPACPSEVAVDLCRLQGPASLSVSVGQQVTIFGRVRQPGITTQTSGTDADPDLLAEVGWGPDGTDPTVDASAWTLVAAAANEGWDDAAEPDFDEYFATFGPGEGGEFDYAYRFSADGGETWTWCDLDGSDNGYAVEQAGALTVAGDPCDSDPCTAVPPPTCEGNTLVTYTGEATCTAPAGEAVCEYASNQTNCVELGTTCEDGTCVGVALPPNPGDVIFSEIMNNPAAVGDDAGEWFEVYNTSPNPVELAGCTIESDGDAAWAISLLTAVLEPGEYLVFGAADSGNGGAPVDVVYTGLQLSNSSDTLALVCNAATIDEVGWDDGATFPDPNGASMQLSPGALDAAANDNGGNWCEATSPYGDGDLGTPGGANDACPDPCGGVVCDQPPAATCEGDTAITWEATGTCDAGVCTYAQAASEDCTLVGFVCQAGQCIDPGQVAPAPAAGELVITEIMNNPDAVGDDAGEWVEITSVADAPRELAGCVFASGNDSDEVIAEGGSLLVLPGQIFIFAKSATANGGVTPAWVWGGANLGNGDDDVAILCGGTVIDAVAWDNGATFPDPTGASMQLDPTALDAVANDDGANWCPSYLAFGDGDLGTPALPNPPCTASCDVIVCDQPPADFCEGDVLSSYGAVGTCTDGVCDYAVESTTDCAAEAATCVIDACVPINTSWPAVGELVITEIMNNPAAVGDDAGEWFEVVNTAAGEVDLEGCVIDSEGSQHVIDAPLPIAAGAYAVFGVNDDGPTNGGAPVDYVFNGLGLGNGFDDVSIWCGGAQIDYVAWDDGATFPDGSGASMQLDAGAIDAASNDLGGFWCLSTLPFGDGDLGSPGLPNESCPDACADVTCDVAPAPACNGTVIETYGAPGTCAGGVCSYPVESSVDCADSGETCFGGACIQSAGGPPAPGEVIFTEITQNPSVVGDDLGEWLELTNISGGDRDLGDCVLSSGNDPDIPLGAVLPIAAGGTVVLAKNGDSAVNGGVPADFEWGGSLNLGNSDDSVTLSCGGQVIDTVAWDNGDTFPDPNGASMQLDPAAFDAAANDLGANWCEATTAFGDGDLGTPNAPNVACELVDPCEGVVCDAPPASDCDGNVVQVYGAAGTCAGGTCSYPLESTLDCAATGEVCVDGACTTVVNSWPAAGEVIFTEITQNPAAALDNDGEWLELTNLTGNSYDLAGCLLESTGDNPPHTMGALALGPNGVVVLSLNADAATNGGVPVDYAYTGLTLGNGADGVFLRCGGVVVDQVEWDDGATFPDPNGASMSLDPGAYDAATNDLGASWCPGTTPFGDGDLGSPGAPNPPCAGGDPCEGVTCDAPPAPACDGTVVETYAATGTCAGGLCSYAVESTLDCAATGEQCVGGACVPLAGNQPAAGEVIITEITQNPSAASDATGEWFELTNLTGTDFDLGGCLLVGGNDPGHTIAALPLAANGVAVLAVSGDSAANGGLSVDYVYTGINLGNGSDSLSLECGGVVVDAVAWDDGATFPDPNGASMQLDPASYDAAANDAGANWCLGSAPYGDGDLGTPGATNLSCAADPCAGVTCDTPPGPDCQGNESRSYAATGTCAGGVCTYAVESTVDCAAQGEVCDPATGLCTQPSTNWPAAGEIIFTEIMQNPAAVGDGAGEWFELTNLSANDYDLAGCLVGSANDTAFALGGLPFAAGATLVFALNTDPALNGGITGAVEYSGLLLGNGTDDLTLICGATIIDQVAWDDGATFPDPNGAAMQLDPGSYDAVANDSGANWCAAQSSYGAGDFGTPGAPNPACAADPCAGVTCLQAPPPTCVGDEAQTFTAPGTCVAGTCEYAVETSTDCAATGQICASGQCVDPPQNWPAAGEVIFTEIMQNPAAVSDSAGEWFELTNVSGTAYDLSGCVLTSTNDNGFTLGAAPIAAGQALVLAAEIDPALNGGISTGVAYDNLFLGNGSDALSLECGGTLIDTVAWDDGATFPDGNGASMQLDPASYDAASNDAGANWCLGQVPYGDGDLGTPGAANPACAVDPCDGVVCDAPPASDCNGDEVQTYAATGTCSGGVCSYAVVSTTDCADTGQICQAGACVDVSLNQPTAGEVIFTEIAQNPAIASDANGEWLEITNLTAETFELAGCRLDSTGDNGHVLGALSLPPQGILVLAVSGDAAVNGGLTADYVYSGVTLGNGADDVTLTCGAEVVDMVAWDDGVTFPDPNGPSMQLDPTAYDASANDLGASWCEGSIPYGDGDLGTPGATNLDCAADPCAGVVCDAPPADDCNGTEVQTYAATGTCAAGVCTYAVASTIDCAETGQLCDPSLGACADPPNDYPAAGEVIFTEITQNPAASADGVGEWFELTNLTGQTFDLAGCIVSSANDQGHVLGALPIGANEALVLAVNADPLVNGGLPADYQYSGLTLGNGADSLLLECGGVIIDDVAWDGGPEWPDPNGASMQLSLSAYTAADNNAGGNWCEGSAPFGDGDLGTPGAANLDCSADPCAGVVCDSPPADDCAGSEVQSYAATGTCAGGVCSYAVESTVDCADTGQECVGGVCVTIAANHPTVGQVIITEVAQNPSAALDADGEWLELTNLTTTDFDLGGCFLTSASDGGHLISGLALPAQGIVVLGVNADGAANGGVPVDYQYGGVLLGNGVDDVALECDGEVIDVVAWDDGATFPDPNGASMSLDPAAYDAASNDAGSAWCEGTTPYGAGDLGSPGAANPDCAGGACDGVVCDAPPADDCNGDLAQTYEAAGTCVAGVCSYAVASTTDCAIGGEICVDGACVPASTSWPAAGEVIFTEIAQNPAAAADATGEWLELTNLSTDSFDLGGCVLGSASDAGHTIAALALAPGASVVLAISGDAAVNGGLSPDYVYAGLTLGNGSDDISLDCGGTLVDVVAWDDGATFPDPTGSSMSLDPGSYDAAANDNGANWCLATSTYGDGDFGTPGASNDSCGIVDPCAGVVCDAPPADDCAGDVAQTYAATGTCSGGTCSYAVESSTDCALTGELCVAGACAPPSNNWPAVGEVIFTEVMQNPAAVTDANGEWFELTNLTGNAYDLEGCSLTSGTDGPHAIAGALPLDGNGVLVFALSGDAATNGGLGADYVYSGLSLGNGDDGLSLECGGATIDAIAWDNGATFPDPNGASMQLDPGSYDASANDAGANWCAAEVAYGAGDLGTPGATNPACTVPDPCEGVVCNDPPPPTCQGFEAIVYSPTGLCVLGGCNYGLESSTDCAAQGLTCQGGACLPAGDEWPAAGEAIFTEIAQNPSAVLDSAGEWLEITNTTGVDFDLFGCTLNSGGDGGHAINGPLPLPAGASIVLGRNGDLATNGGVPVDYVYADVSLGNAADDLSLECGGVTVDLVAWDDGATFPDPNGASMQLDPGSFDATANDDGANWCEGSTPFGDGDLGTPGAPNLACAGDPCAGVVCDTPPGPECSGDELILYAASGTCTGGACDYPVEDTVDCASTGEVCDAGAGACVPATGVWPAAGEVVITEIMQNPAQVGEPDGEWLELYNPTGSDFELTGCTLLSDNDLGHTISGLALPAGGLVVLGRSGDTATNGGFTADYVFTGVILGNGADSVTLDCGGVVDTVAWDDGASFPDPNGASMSLDPSAFDAALNDVGSNWCQGQTAYGDGDLGTPGAANVVCTGDPCAGVVCDTPPAAFCVGDELQIPVATGTCTAGACDYPVESTVDCAASGEVCDNALGACVPPAANYPLAGEVIFTEIMQNPAAVSDANGEWFELTNLTGEAFDLVGCTLGSASDSGHVVDASLVLGPSGVVVLAKSGDSATNGGVTADHVFSDINLGNGADDLSLTCDGVLVDVVAWDDGATFPDPNGASMNLDPASYDAAANDDGGNWCLGAAPYGAGDLGTPGATNNACTGDPCDGVVCDTPPADECSGDEVLIYAATGTCSGGVCSYPVESTVDCLAGGQVCADGACIDPTGSYPAAGEVVITEIMQNPSAAADAVGEWFEITNLTSNSFDLEGCDILSDNDGGHTITGSLTLSPVGTLVFGVEADSAVNGGVAVDYVYTGVLLGNGSDQIQLVCGATTVDAVAWDDGATFPDPNGASMQLDILAYDAVMNDEGANWCASTAPLPGGDFGTPNADNGSCTIDPCDGVVCDSPPADACNGDEVQVYSASGTCGGGVCTYPVESTVDCAATGQLCQAGACVDPPTDYPAAGQVIITEVLQNPAAVGDAAGEWFELTNLSGEDFDLAGCVIGSGGETHTLGTLAVAPNQILVLGVEADSLLNGGVTVDYEFFGLTLSNTSDDLSLTCGGELIDIVAWDDGATFPDPNGASMQLDPGAYDATSNDDGASWCPAAAPFGDGDLGTPGAVNLSCTVDPCDGVICDSPPADDCNGDEVQMYAATGTCSGGVCSYAVESTVDCASTGEICVDGACAPAPNVWPGAGQVIISEVMQNPSAAGDATGEWLELTNLTGTDFDLSGCVLMSANDADHVLGALPLAGQAIAVLGVSGDTATNGGVTVDYVYSGLTLGNGSDSLTLDCGGVVVDTIAWDDGATFPDPNGASMSLEPSAYDATSNDDGANWCDAPDAIPGGAGDFGSPGQPNPPCPVDPCEGVVCDAAPADECDGDTVLSYSAPGTCAAGICDYPVASSTDCTLTGQVCVDGACETPVIWPAAGEIIFTEVMQNPAAVSDAAGEWFELTNLTSGSLDLEGCLLASASDGGHTFGALSIGPNEAVVLAANGDSATNGGLSVDYVYTGVNLGNGSDNLEIFCGGTVVDLLAWDDGATFPDPTGAAMQLDPGQYNGAFNDEGANWCEAAAPYGDGDLGSPGAVNPACAVDLCAGVVCDAAPVATCNGNVVEVFAAAGTCDPADGLCDYPVESTIDCSLTGELCIDDAAGAQCVPDFPGEGQVLITEIMQNPAAVGDGPGEWFELTNLTSNTFELEGCDILSANDGGHVIGALTIGPNEILVFGVDADTGTNGGVDVDYVYGGVALGNSSDDLILGCGLTLVDGVVWDDGQTFPDPDGASMQLDIDAYDATSNDDGSNWCEGTTAFGAGDLGTPGAANADCAPVDLCAGVVCDAPPVPACNGEVVETFAASGTCDPADGLCDYAVASTEDCALTGQVCIDDAAGAACFADFPAEGEVIITEIMQNPSTASDAAGEWFELTNLTANTFDLGGCDIFSANDGGHVIAGSLVLGPSEVIVLGINGDTAANGGVVLDYVYDSVALGNGSDDIVLGCGATLVDGVAWDDGQTFPDPNGVAMQLNPSDYDATANDSGSSWCLAVSAYGDGDLGTPGATNDPCSADLCAGVVCDSAPVAACKGNVVETFAASGTCDPADGLCDYAVESSLDCGLTGETCVDDAAGATCVGAQPAAGEVIFTEITQNPAAVGDGAGEWFELTNLTANTFDLTGCVLSSANDTDQTLGDLSIGANAAIVLAINGDSATNGGLTVDYVYAGLALGNGSDDLTLTCGSTTVDTVAWDDGATFPDPNGASMQLDPASYDATSNDQGANWCEGATAFGAGDLGTPGAANEACAVDLCAGVVCDAPPVPTCNGNVVETFAASGTCDPADGLCDYAVESSLDCTLTGELCIDDAAGAQCVPDFPAEGDVIITEIMQNPAAVADTAGEWFELTNLSANNYDLEGCVFVSTGDAGHTVAGPLTIGPDETLVFGVNGDGATNGGVPVDYVYSGLVLGNGSDDLILGCGAATIDGVVWDDGATFPDPDGASMQLDPGSYDDLSNDSGASWCESTATFGDGDLGTPGVVNPECGTIGPVAPAAGEVIFTEITQNPAAVGDGSGEWFELTNLTGSELDLAGCQIQSTNDSGYSIAGPLTIAAGGTLVFAVNGDSGTNGGLTVDEVYTGINLGNGSDALTLDCGGVIDSVAWDDGGTFPDPNGASMQLDIDAYDAASNDSGANWCEGTDPFGAGDLGTPNAPNNDCAVVDLCAGVVCDTPPVDTCNGTLIETFEATGTCDPSDGLCDYAVASSVDCALTGEVCVDDAAGASCQTPAAGLPGTGDLIITEVMQNPDAVGDSAGEWFEVLNVSGGDLDLAGCVLSSAGDSDHIIAEGGSLPIADGAYLVFVRNGDDTTNGGITGGYPYASAMNLGNGADDLTITCSSVVVDTIAWDGGTDWPDPTGASMQLGTSFYDATLNDTGTNWCEATASYGAGDLGTPGADNSSANCQ